MPMSDDPRGADLTERQTYERERHRREGGREGGGSEGERQTCPSSSHRWASAVKGGVRYAATNPSAMLSLVSLYLYLSFSRSQICLSASLRVLPRR
eukprot:COSAG03_NODE_267_length_9666_cov_13.197868_3_plen_96_part_00